MLRPTLVAAALACVYVPSNGAPGPIDYSVQLTSSFQHQDNPGRLSRSVSDKRATGVFSNSAGVGLRIPLLSDETRLDVAGTLGDARYGSAKELNHHPRSLVSTLHVRAGSLLAGRIDYGRQDQLNDYLDRSWPERDIVTRENRQAELGLRVTDSLTLPVVGAFSNDTSHDKYVYKNLYNREDSGWQVAARYVGKERSFAQMGWRHTNVRYPERNALQRQEIDDRYNDNELFIESIWDYSDKTLLTGRAGMVQRDYRHLIDRDTTLFTFDAEALWDYSPKTQFNLQMYRRPYASDDDPTVLYSVRTGAALTTRWKATEKTSLTLGIDRAVQKNTLFSGGSSERLQVLRYGARVEWQADMNLRWIVDFYRDRQTGGSASGNYTQSFIRVGIEYTFGSNDGGVTRKLLVPGECNYRRPALPLC